MGKNNTQKHKEAKSNNRWRAMEGLTIGIDMGDKRSCYCALDRGAPVTGDSAEISWDRWQRRLPIRTPNLQRALSAHQDCEWKPGDGSHFKNSEPSS